MQATNKKACQLLGWDRKSQGDELATGHCGFVPVAQSGLRFWDRDDMAAGLFYIDQRKAGFTVKQAGQAATRLRAGMRDYLDADQLAVITLQNGSMSILPAAGLDLSTGYLSGGFLHTATVIDARNLRGRLQRAIDADAAIFGEVE